MKKYNYRDHFEMVYLRHEYLTKCDKLEGKYVKEFEPIVKTTARIMYDKLYPNYHKVGFRIDDIISITNVYMLGFMGLYSLRNNKKALGKFVKEYRQKNQRRPSETEIKARDRNNMINYLRQRLQHCSSVCARKARSITVGEDRRGAFAETENSIDVSKECIWEDPKKYGYRKLSKDEWKEVKIRAKKSMDRELIDKDGFRVIEMEFLNNGISHEDYSFLMESNKSRSLMNPEALMEEIEGDIELDRYKEKFGSMDLTKKKRTLRRFVDRNRGNKYLKRELALARKMLRNKEFMV